LLTIIDVACSGSLGQAYIEKNPLAALQAFAIAGGWEQTSFMKRHFLGRALVSAICYNTRHHIHPVDVKCSHGSKHAVVQVAVPDEWIDSLLPGVRRVNELVKARNSRLQTDGKRQADDKVSDRAAEGFLQTTLNTGVAFWQNLPFHTQRCNIHIFACHD